MQPPRERIPTLPDGVAAQHGQLATAIRRVRHAHATGRPREELAALIDELIGEVQGHFAFEESAMERGSYPDLEPHRAMHAAFLRRLTALRAECDRRESELLGVLVELLESWFRSHEETADRRAAKHLGLEA